MKIGIDAKWYFSGPPSGKVVMQNLIKNLFLLNPNITLILFVKRAEIEKFSREPYLSSTDTKFELVPVNGSYNYLLNMFTVPILAHRNKVDKMIYLNFAPLVKVGKTKNIALIFDFLFLDYPRFFSFSELVIYRLMKFLTRSVSHVITISNSESKRIKKHTKLESNQVSFIHLAADSLFRTYDSNKINEILHKYQLPKTFLLYVGRLNVRKNIPVLIKALKLTRSNVELVIIGSKDLKSFDIDKSIKDLRLHDRVKMLGFVPDEDMAVILSAATIFCYPSFAEGFGLPPLEALASGTPVLTTKLTSIPEVCSDAAIYFNPTNEAELAEKIDLLLEDNNLRVSQIKKGLERAKLFKWTNSAKNLLKIVMKV